MKTRTNWDIKFRELYPYSHYCLPYFYFYFRRVHKSQKFNDSTLITHREYFFRPTAVCPFCSSSLLLSRSLYRVDYNIETVRWRSHKKKLFWKHRKTQKKRQMQFKKDKRHKRISLNVHADAVTLYVWQSFTIFIITMMPCCEDYWIFCSFKCSLKTFFFFVCKVWGCSLLRLSDGRL